MVGLFDNTSSDKFCKGIRNIGYKNEMSTLKANGPTHSIYLSNDYTF